MLLNIIGLIFYLDSFPAYISLINSFPSESLKNLIPDPALNTLFLENIMQQLVTPFVNK